ncbi:hypothetical protein [Falsiroseomonas sp. CW058]|uniref:hypothetical protein n=1 Tax=Falsiroseomonas sp. CW058 TaxID=3388664 RepID=UPI003D316F11
MIRALILALPISLLGWWALRRLGQARPRAWAGGVALSALVVGLIVLSGDDHPDGRALLAGLWLGVHLVLFAALRPLLGRER